MRRPRRRATGGPPWIKRGARARGGRGACGPHGRGPHGCPPDGRRRRGWSIRKKLFLWFVVAIIATAATMSMVFMLLGKAPWEEQALRVERFTRGRFDAVWRDPPARAELAGAIEDELGVGVSLFAPDGHPLRSSTIACAEGSGAPPWLEHRSRERPHHGRAPRVSHQRSPRGGNHHRGETSAHALPYHTVHGVTVFRDDGSAIVLCAPRTTHGPSRLAAGLAAVLLMLLVLSGALARTLGRPILQIAGVAERLGEGELGARVEPIPRQQEAAVPAQLLNRLAERVERQLNDQRELLAGVSHELRTPLGHIRLLLELAREGLLDEASVGELEREVDAMDRLVGELLARSRLDFSRIDASALDAGLVAARALERLGMDIARLDAPEEALSFRADPTLVDQALANLLENARVHGGGVQALRVTSGEELADAVRFEIQDNGPGFRADAFEAFVSERSPRTGAHSGSGSGAGTHPSLGLGLALVRRIARAHGGRVGVRPPPEGARGATVWLELPREPDVITDRAALDLA